MIKKLMAASILIALLCTMMANAQTPQKGDRVRIVVGEGLVVTAYEGTIIGIDNGLICLNSTYAESGDTILWDEPTNTCIGTGKISALRWLDEDWEPV